MKLIELQRWLSCEDCGLHKSRTEVVIGKGYLPCEVMYIGEGPGRSEDIVGEPFIGAAGSILKSAFPDDAPQSYITNLVACRPCDSPNASNRQPSEDEIKACSGRLKLILELAIPKAIVLLGRLAQSYQGEIENALKKPTIFFHLPHPAYILRLGGKKSGEYKRYVQKLHGFLAELKR